MASVKERFFSKVEQLPNRCWRWTDALDACGYGKLTVDYKPLMAHRLIYELMAGKLTPDLEIDHLCKNTWCVNPFHLEEVTHTVNMERAVLQPRRTHCFNGHEFTSDNTRITNGYYRSCKICWNNYMREYMRRNKK